MSGFIGEVLQTRGMASMDEFRETFGVIDNKISTLKVELSRSLQSCFSACDADIDRVSSWHVECVGIQEDTERLKDQLEQNKTASALSVDDMNSLNDEIVDCKQNIGILRTLIDIVQNLELADSDTDIHKSSMRLKKAEDDLLSITKEFRTDEDASWIKQMELSIANRVTGNYERAMKEWNAKFRFEKNSLIVDPYRGDITLLLETFSNLGYYEKVWETFCNHFWQELLSKACTPDYTVDFTTPTQSQMRRRSMVLRREDIPVRDSDPDIEIPVRENPCPTLYVIRVKKLETPYQSADFVFQNVTKLVENLSEMFSAKLETMQELGEILGAQLVHVLHNKCLKTLILQNSDADKNRGMDDIACLKAFREKLWEFNFKIPDETLLDEFENNFDSMFVNQFRQNRLGEIRQLIRADIHQTIKIDPETSFEMVNLAEITGDRSRIGVFHKNPFAQQKYTISKSISTMVDILKEHLLQDPKDTTLIANALNLYISIVVIPKHESELKDFLPLSAVLIHNNCWFLSHHVEVSFPGSVDNIPLLRTKATQAYTFMMRSVRTKLNNMIAAAMTGVNDEVDNSKKGNVAKKFLEISEEFHRLNHVFLEVLPPSVLTQTLSTLLDHTVNHICSKVLSWEDISSNSANALADCFVKFAEATSSLFKSNASSVREIDILTSKAVHHWQRFRLITFILTASMKEIGDKWINGCGPLSQAFTADEIRKLVRALFQNTDRRAAFLSSIK